ncbi:MAG: hypothetical protein DME23_18460 [Verrucomicrobia bacterium]|nr:MAG: hypothetical protein DME23_18460 [Verrucomicrobiota bacterium]
MLSAAGIATSLAQGTVYSVNAVGYINLTIPPGFSIIANQLDNIVGSSPDNRLSALIPTAADGTTVYKFTGSGYSISTYDVLQPGWLPNGNDTLNPGEAAFIRNSTSGNITITFVGQVPQGHLVNSIPANFSMKSSMVPQAGAVDSVLGLVPPLVQDGDTIYQFSNAQNKYVINTYDALQPGWLPATPVLQVGEGFFIKKNGAGSWVRDFSVNQ